MAAAIIWQRSSFFFSFDFTNLISIGVSGSPSILPFLFPSSFLLTCWRSVNFSRIALMASTSSCLKDFSLSYSKGEVIIFGSRYRVKIASR